MNNTTAEITAKGQAAINAFVAALTKRISEQFAHDVAKNLPAGRVDAEDVANAAHAIRQGVASALAAHVQWDCNETTEWAACILEESNCHGEAATLRNAA